MEIFGKVKDLKDKVVLKTKQGKITKKNFEKINSVESVLKDIEENRNRSWYEEIYERNKNNLEDIAILYRGNKITYKEMFENMKKYAKSLKSYGLQEDSEIPACLSNSPELIYILGASSMIGAKVNIFGAKYPKDYITEIINGCNTDIIFVEDNAYDKIRDAIKKSKNKTIVMNSLRDSLKDDVNPYEELDSINGLFNNKVELYKNLDSNILNTREFIERGKNYSGNLIAKTDLDTDFAITYTSGSTNEKRPKAIVHATRSFNTIGRFHDKELNGGFSLKNYTILAHIPPYSNTNLVSAISDSLMQGATVALEPFYDKDFFIHTLNMYKPNYVAATKSYWVNTAKKILYDKEFENYKLKDLFLAFSCGEPFEINEEKLINKAFKKAKTGVNITKTPFSIIKMSEAGGDCEHGSIFYTLFRAIGNKKPSNLISGSADGLKPFQFVDVAILNEKNEKCKPNEYGRIVAKSPCTMKRYKNNPEATKAFFIKDADGVEWGDLNVYGYMDKDGRVNMLGRIPKEGELLPPYVLSKKILKDTKNILSCEVIKDDEKDALVAHVEMQPEARKSIDSTLYGAYERCSDILDEYDTELYFRLHSNKEAFPLTGSGKRDVKAIKKEGLTDKCIKVRLENDNLIIEQYSEKVPQKIKIR